FKDEFVRRAGRNASLRDRISEIPLPWSNYSKEQQGKYLHAHSLIGMLEVAFGKARVAFDEVNTVQGYSLVLLSEKVLSTSLIDIAVGNGRVRKLARQYRKLIAPLQKKFGVVPKGILLKSIQDFTMHLRVIDLILDAADKSLAA